MDPVGLLAVRPFLIVLSLLFVVALAASRFVPKVDRIEVAGAQHHTTEDLLHLARLAPGDPWLWVTRWRLRGLEQDPWVLRSRVIRHWPSTVSLTVWERIPAVTDGTHVWAADGTLLPHATPGERSGVPLLTGWGEPRLPEALELVELFANEDLEVISYSPTGFELELADGAIFTPDVDTLRRQWAAIQHRNGRRLAVYPWGVSKADD